MQIENRGIVATGIITSGQVKVGDKLALVRANGDQHAVKIQDIEIFRKDTTTASKGDQVGLLLPNVNKNEISKGDILQSQ